MLQTLEQYKQNKEGGVKPAPLLKKEKPIEIKAPEKKEPIKTVFFIHPERPMNGTLDFDVEFKLKGNMVRVICENSIIKTNNPDLIEYYRLKKYEILKEE